MNALNSIIAATVTLAHADMLKALTNTCKVIEKKNTVPALSGVLIRESLGGLEFIGTDLDMTNNTFVHCEAPRGFATLIPAHTALNILTKAKAADEVTLTLTEKGCRLSVGKLNVNLDQAADLVDFPAKPLESVADKLATTNHSFVITSDLLRTAIAKTEFAISTEETRYYLNGLFVHTVESEGETVMRFVTTDGHRLSKFEIPCPAGAGGMPDIIVPSKAVKELHRLLKRKDCPESVLVSTCDVGASFLIGEDELVQTKAIDGTFPDYTRVIPTGNDEAASISPSVLADALKQVTVISSERGRAVKFEFGEDSLKLTSNDPDTGSADMTVRCASAISNVIGLNYRYILDLVGMIEGHMQLKMNGSNNPIIVNDMADDRVTFVQMPMRI